MRDWWRSGPWNPHWSAEWMGCTVTDLLIFIILPLLVLLISGGHHDPGKPLEKSLILVWTSKHGNYEDMRFGLFFFFCWCSAVVRSSLVFLPFYDAYGLTTFMRLTDLWHLLHLIHLIICKFNKECHCQDIKSNKHGLSWLT